MKKLTMKLETENIVVYHDRLNDWLFVSCANQLTFEEVRQGFNECLEIIEKHHCARLIVDSYAVKYSPLLHEINRWLANDWLPVANEQGLRFIAQLTPADPNWRLFDAPSERLIRPSVKISHFGTLVSAVKWICTQH